MGHSRGHSNCIPYAWEGIDPEIGRLGVFPVSLMSSNCRTEEHLLCQDPGEETASTKVPGWEEAG